MSDVKSVTADAFQISEFKFQTAACDAALICFRTGPISILPNPVDCGSPHSIRGVCHRPQRAGRAGLAELLQQGENVHGSTPTVFGHSGIAS